MHVIRTLCSTRCSRELIRKQEVLPQQAILPTGLLLLVAFWLQAEYVKMERITVQKDCYHAQLAMWGIVEGAY